MRVNGLGCEEMPGAWLMVIEKLGVGELKRIDEGREAAWTVFRIASPKLLCPLRKNVIFFHHFPPTDEPRGRLGLSLK